MHLKLWTKKTQSLTHFWLGKHRDNLFNLYTCWLYNATLIINNRKTTMVRVRGVKTIET